MLPAIMFFLTLFGQSAKAQWTIGDYTAGKAVSVPATALVGTVPNVNMDYSTITTAISGKLDTGGTAAAVAIGGVDFSTITTRFVAGESRADQAAMSTTTQQTALTTLGLSTNTLAQHDFDIGASTKATDARDTAIGVDTKAAQGQIYLVGTDTNTQRTALTAIGASTATEQSQIYNVGTDTASMFSRQNQVAVSTANEQTQIYNVGGDTRAMNVAVALSTTNEQSQIYLVGTDTKATQSQIYLVGTDTKTNATAIAISTTNEQTQIYNVGTDTKTNATAVAVSTTNEQQQIYNTGTSSASLQVQVTAVGASTLTLTNVKASTGTEGTIKTMTLPVTWSASGTFTNASGVQIKGGLTLGTDASPAVKMSSSPYLMTGMYVSTESLKSGDTVYSFIPDAGITLRRLIMRNLSAGIGGAGDYISCNSADSSISTISAGIPFASVRMTEKSSPGPYSNVAAGTEIFCHYDGASTTKPQLYFMLSWVMQ